VQRAPDLPYAAEPPIVHERYMHWVLVADTLAVVPLVYWMGRPKDAYLAVPSLLLPPVIHTLHGESDKALVSLIMRTAMIAGVYYAGRSFQDECSDDRDELVCIPIRSFFIANAAIIPVIMIDAVFLARATRRADGWQRLPLQPNIGVTADGRTWLSLGTTF
jgi:hypothetical protein